MRTIKRRGRHFRTAGIGVRSLWDDASGFLVRRNIVMSTADRPNDRYIFPVTNTGSQVEVAHPDE